MLGRIEPIDCDSLVMGTIDYVGGATGVSDIVAETLTTQAIAHHPGDQIVVDGNRTAIVRGGRTLYIAEWRQTDAGGWLLTETQACQAPLLESPGPEE